MKSNMRECFASIQHQLPKNIISMTNFIKNNQNINKLPSNMNFNETEKEQIYKRFAEYLLNKGGIDEMKNGNNNGINNVSNNRINIVIDTSDMANSLQLQKAFTVEFICVYL